MKESKHSHNQDLGSGTGRPHRRILRSWDRMHHSWLFWIALGLMLAAITYFAMSNNLALRP